MAWEIFTGSGTPRPARDAGGEPAPAWRAIPPVPPWRAARRPTDVPDGTAGAAPLPFCTTPPLVDAVNAALHLRRPLLLTGLPGSGKSSLVDVIAAELQLGDVLRWHVTSKSTLQDALYQYDALGQLQAAQVGAAAGGPDLDRHTDVERFVSLGPLGTALASPDRPRAVLVDEIDKSDLDLPGDLLNVLERGEFGIAPLLRAAAPAGRPDEADRPFQVRGEDGGFYSVPSGVVRAEHFPVIVFTSNGERTFPPPFLRRCVQFEMPRPDASLLHDIVAAHLSDAAATSQRQLIEEFAGKLAANSTLAIDQLLSVVYLATGEAPPGSATRKVLETLLLAELGRR